MRRSPEETKYKVPGILSQRSYMDAPNFPAIVCDNMWAMSTNEAHLSYGVHSFSGGQSHKTGLSWKCAVWATQAWS